MKRIIFVTALLIFVFQNQLFCQTIDLKTDTWEELRVFVKFNVANENEVEGSPYLNEKWMSGNVQFIGKEEVKADSLRFNINKEEVLFRYKGIEYFIDNSKDLITFSIGNSRFIKFMNAESNSKSFFEVLVDAKKLKLLRNYKCVIVKGQKSDGIKPDVLDKYSTKSSFFTMLNSEPARRFKGKKDKLLMLMSDHKDEVVTFIKKNGLSVKKEGDLIKIFTYYNTL